MLALDALIPRLYTAAAMEDLLSESFTAAIAEGTGCCLLPHLFDLSCSDASAASFYSFSAPSDREDEILRSEPSEETPFASGSASDGETQAPLKVAPSPPLTLRAAGGPCQHCGAKGESCAFSMVPGPLDGADDHARIPGPVTWKVVP